MLDTKIIRQLFIISSRKKDVTITDPKIIGVKNEESLS